MSFTCTEDDLEEFWQCCRVFGIGCRLKRIKGELRVDDSQQPLYYGWATIYRGIQFPVERMLVRGDIGFQEAIEIYRRVELFVFEHSLNTKGFGDAMGMIKTHPDLAEVRAVLTMFGHEVKDDE